MIICKSKAEIEIMREAGRLVALTHKELQKAIRPGITTSELDAIAETFIRKHGAKPSFKGYGGFAGSICTSVNEELVHGIPGNRKLNEGDIISLDIGAEVDGYHGDSAWTYGVGQISRENQHLLDITEKSLYEGLAQAKPDARLTDISHAIQVCVEEAGYSIVREYVGHGIGRDLHEDPQIPNFGPPGRGPRLKTGMVLAIEPMVNAGKRYVRTLADNWTVVTVDGSMCAHFEHTIAITEDGYEILTKE
ncbi:type I methionyl aminopeptidase [Aneurinibacillus aneurinilyticus]|jgi:methionyl aminopeptidase|uniref:Methionine aminopeptidase n=2 Tax=Aneurinibacillus aneurinilyticus TaxID=1391 RepID=A0A848D1C2_ANEAE|nr:type I methionyl aminopeptidase [Aneurinibacillus aneurinilyticus]ERI06764.1 methionine aminopeptidase, type I [Aneurinibacillus aneurinilyticus ATCC 12856]MCI1695226.1 type I methionyl aminopeptidase [Aneurinibacillus aneurinilyticus]MED0673303.1 type I methionyl aminopeptidase [Aneurinibacillus aneurinilyticus]MED0707325.1 type I methionyl aminopeptidase [Aneurinibacillus aneurinilyticus]MED0721628.1 type I methionyl aminopeptidase [Aneurinibacillus aneurinilyticus]